MDIINELIKVIEGNLEDLNGDQFNWGTIKVRDAGRIQEKVLLAFEYRANVASYLNHRNFIEVLTDLMISTTGEARVFESSYTRTVTSVILMIGNLKEAEVKIWDNQDKGIMTHPDE